MDTFSYLCEENVTIVIVSEMQYAHILDALDALGITETVSEICIPTRYTALMQPVILPGVPAIPVRRFSHLQGLLQYVSEC